MRPRRTASSTRAVKSDEVTSEQYIRAFGIRYGWDLTICNVMFEGTTDVAYLELANALYAAKEKKTLIDGIFRVFPIGVADEGGTDGMMDRLRLLAETLRIFPIQDQTRGIKVICVFDDDAKGRGAFSAMSRKFIPWNDIFLLRRKYPRNTRDPKTFERSCAKLNEAYLSDKSFFCEIEDLIARPLIDDFVDANPGCLQKEIRSCGDGFHCDLRRTAKGSLVKFVQENAILKDIELLVELLKSLRFLFNLPVDGTPIDGSKAGHETP